MKTSVWAYRREMPENLTSHESSIFFSVIIIEKKVSEKFHLRSIKVSMHSEGISVQYEFCVSIFAGCVTNLNMKNGIIIDTELHSNGGKRTSSLRSL